MWAAAVAMIAMIAGQAVLGWNVSKMQRKITAETSRAQAEQQRLAANNQADAAIAQADLMERDAQQIERQGHAFEAQGLVDSANAQRAAIDARQQGGLISGEARSLAAASGMGMNSPSIARQLARIEHATDYARDMNLAQGAQARKNSQLQARDAMAQAASQRYASTLQRQSADWIRAGGENQANQTIWLGKVQNQIAKAQAKQGLFGAGAQAVGTAAAAYGGGGTTPATTTTTVAASQYRPIAVSSQQSPMYVRYGGGGYQSPYNGYQYTGPGTDYYNNRNYGYG